MQLSPEKASLPDNVPAELVVDLNVYRPEGGNQDLHGTWRRIQATSPDIMWCPYNGGHWLPTRFEDIDFIQRNHDPFSMRDVGMPSGLKPTRILPLEADPPEHLGFRMIINPFFTPKIVSGLDHFTRELAVELIREIKPRGRCEFMAEFAQKLPIAIFMRLADLPMDDAPELLRLAEQSTRGGAELQASSQMAMMAYITPFVEERRANPGSDLISAIVHAKVKGNQISDTDMMSTLLTVLFGGLDTVASTMGFMAEFLGRHPAHRQQLIDDPKLIPNAVNEMMRRFGPSSTARTLSRDYDYKGIHFKEGDKVHILPLLAGMDERRFTGGWNIDFERREGDHASFGSGPHRCPGQLLALLELRIFVEEWLKQIPDFRVSDAEPPSYGTGMVNCVETIVLEWDN